MCFGLRTSKACVGFVEKEILRIKILVGTAKNVVTWFSQYSCFSTKACLKKGI
jgi:hypothetical protein